MPTRSARSIVLIPLVLGPWVVAAQEPDPAAAFAGTWVGHAVHRGESTTVALTIAVRDDGAVGATLSLPVIHVRDVPIGRVRRDGRALHAGVLDVTWDSAAGELRGTMPAAIVPVHAIPVTLRRGEAPAFPPRPAADAPPVQPVWTFDAGAPLWSDLGAARDLVFVGADDGVVHALEAATGRPRWSARTGGAVRARPTVAGDALYVHADDGFLYRFDVASGAERWRVRTTTDPIVRVPPPGQGSRWDTRGSAVAAAGGRLYVGTHDGRVLALDPADGRRLWVFTTDGPVIATPAAAGGRVLAGSFDGRIYALEAATGSLLWSHETGAPVTSTPTPVGDVVVTGGRSYDLFGLDAATGAVRWNRYVWFSWIESTPAAHAGVAYVGSSDAALIMAVDVATGRRVWDADVLGASWGTPAVTGDAVFVGTRGQTGAFSHRPGMLVLDRATGRVRARYAVTAAEGAAFTGFAASPALAGGRVVFGAVDGRVYAFDAAR